MPPEYWGYLVKADKNPSPVFEQLLVSIANYINRQIAPWHVACLTPTKLAAFYRLVGGDYDPLFLETPKASLSFIYQSMGCFHTLQPEKDPYLAPSIPTLTIQGFIRFQTIQLLLEPDLHASFLQNAVKRLDLINPADGLPFPNRLPRNALPSRPDPEVVSWHGGVAENLRIESASAETGGPRTQALAQFSDTAPDDLIASFNDRQAVIDMNYCYTPPRPRPAFRPPPSIKVPRTIDAKRTNNLGNPHPWDLQRQWSSTSDLRSPTTSPLPVQGSATNVFPPQHNRNPPRPRSPSTVSVSSISSSSSSSLTASSASVSPRLCHSSPHFSRPQHCRQAHDQRPYYNGRRHSSHWPYSPREPNNDDGIPARLPASHDRPFQPPSEPSSSYYTASNTRLVDRGNAASSVQGPGNISDRSIAQKYTNSQRRSIDDEEVERSKGGTSGTLAGVIEGVRGRKYAATRTS
ncbi:MAG: hypothetical protein Q9180_001200 [Flavoplaca navasiana]